MEIDALAKGVGIFSTALSAFKQALDLLPNNSKKEEAVAALARAEREFKVAEAEVASKLKYEICRSHFPPVIMLSKDDMIWECPECKNTKDNTPGIA
jgi:hypothetical protein